MMDSIVICITAFAELVFSIAAWIFMERDR